VSGRDLQRFADALERQLAEEVAPVWGRYVGPFIAKPATELDPKTWVLNLWKNPRDARDAGALGYHETSGKDCVPVGHVFTELAEKDGSWTTIADHEALEMVGDEWVNMEVARLLPNGSVELWPRELCFSGETRVDMADGTQRVIQELAAESRTFSIRTIEASGRRGVAEAVAWQTGTAVDVVRVRLTDGRSVRCTPYHRFMLTDGTYKAAKHLEHGDQLYSDVTPRLSAPHFADRRAIDAEPFRQHFITFGADTNLSNAHFGQSAPTNLLTTKVAIACQSLLAGRVEHVLAVRAKEEVIRIDAGGCVALVANLHPFRNLTVRPREGQAMREVELAAITDLAVALRVGRTYPQPAGLGLVDAGPEPVLNRRRPVVVRRVAPSGGIRGAGSLQPPEMRRAEVLRPVGSGATVNRAETWHGSVVDAVQPDGKADVYDLHVPETHNFAIEGGIYVHNCDAVQGLTYMRKGVELSDFVLPEYFIEGSDGPYDFLGKLDGPFTIDETGYSTIRTIKDGRVKTKDFYGPRYAPWRKEPRTLSRKASRFRW